MAKIGIFYGSTAGVTEEIAEKLVEYFDEDTCSLYNMEDDKPDFTGKTIAFFGAGDCGTHGENFVSALGILYDYFKEAGATIVGEVPTDGYTFNHSFAVRDGKFVGLPIDEVNESEKTEERIESWIKNLRQYFPQ